jgi:hypothetical protein
VLNYSPTAAACIAKCVLSKVALTTGESHRCSVKLACMLSCSGSALLCFKSLQHASVVSLSSMHASTLCALYILTQFSCNPICMHTYHMLQDGESVGRVLALADKCNGYILTSSHDDASLSKNKYVNELFRTAFGSSEAAYEITAAVQERYMFKDSSSSDKAAETSS